MNFWQLKIFIEVMRSNSVSIAAKNLGRTQSTISVSIINLETKIGYKLFERQGKRLHPLPEAFFLFEEGQKIIEIIDNLEQALKKENAEVEQEIKVACMPLVAEFIIPKLVSQFTKHFPKVSFQVASMHSESVYKAVASNTYDIGFAERLKISNLVNELAYEAEFLCAVSSSDPLAKNEFVTPKDLDTRPCVSYLRNHFLTARMEELFQESGCVYNAKYRFQNASVSGVQLIAQGSAYGVVGPWAYSKWGNFSNSNEIAYVRMRPAVQSQYALLTSKLHKLSRVALKFHKMLNEEFDDLLRHYKQNYNL